MKAELNQHRVEVRARAAEPVVDARPVGSLIILKELNGVAVLAAAVHAPLDIFAVDWASKRPEEAAPRGMPSLPRDLYHSATQGRQQSVQLVQSAIAGN